MQAFFISIPHSGERVPPEVSWLSGLTEAHLMRDVDRYVDQLYKPVIDSLAIPSIVTEWHRYVVDLNRTPDEFDSVAVMGAKEPPGTFPKGLHWTITTHKEPLIERPMSMDLHKSLVENYYDPFHRGVKKFFADFKDQGFKNVYQLDCHSMPSEGTKLHADFGEKRAEVVISDGPDKSCNNEYRDLVVESYKSAGFEVKMNWPYIGGGITQTYGQPDKGQNTIQVELNRRLYMDEETKKKSHPLFEETQKKLAVAIEQIYKHIKTLPS